MIGAAFLGLVSVSCDRGGNIDPDPEPVTLTNGFAKFIENTGTDIARYYVVLTTGTGTSIDDVTGPGDILLLEILTENTSIEDSYITPGTYNYSSTSTDAGTVVLSYHSQFGKVGSSGDMDLKIINGGNMTVSESGGVYAISGTFTEPAGDEFEFNYNGAIVFPAKPISMTGIDVTYIGLKGWTNHNHYVAKFTNAENEEVSLFLDGFKTYFYDGINPDTYVYSATLNTNSGFSNGDSQLVKSDDSYFMYEGVKKLITGGQVEIAKDGDNFLITGKVESQDGTEYKFQYAGPMPMKKAKLNLNIAVFSYYSGNFFWSKTMEGIDYGHPDVGMFVVKLSNLEGEGDIFYNGPGECLSFTFGVTPAANGTVAPVNYMQEVIPDGVYEFAPDDEDPDSYTPGKLWPMEGDWNDIDFITTDSSLSHDKTADSSIEVTKGEGKNYTITGNITTTNDIEIEFVFDGPITLKSTDLIRPYSIMSGHYAMPQLTKAFFYDYGEEEGVYEGELYLGTADSYPEYFDEGDGEFIVLNMFRPDEDDLLPVGNDHFSIARYYDYQPMTVNGVIVGDWTFESSWFISSNYDEYVPILGVESLQISKAPGGIYTINFTILDDNIPANRISGSYTGEILDWDDEPINAPGIIRSKKAPRNYVEKRPENKKRSRVNISEGTSLLK